jgi:tRNA(Arg) A34 adenosine deaminase TadA
LTDREYLACAIKLSHESEEPTKCACILVKDGEIIAETYNSQRADIRTMHHAEIKAIGLANKRLGQCSLVGTVAYCSCEPCVMCLSALSLARVDRIVCDERMIDVAPDYPMSRIDSQEFADEYLQSAPKLERLVIS